MHSPELQKIFKYINQTPELLSLLYDLNLMPEEVDWPSSDGNKVIVLTLWHQNKFGPTILGNEPT